VQPAQPSPVERTLLASVSRLNEHLPNRMTELPGPPPDVTDARVALAESLSSASSAMRVRNSPC